MDTILHGYLCKLRIISKIPVGGKLDTTQNNLDIYNNGMFNWIYRKIYGDNKENATKYLIDLYREINSFSEQLMDNIESEKNVARERRKIIMLVSLTEKMKESINGIRNLIGTYKAYLKIVSLLECLEQDILIPQYRILLKFIPDQYYTDILRLPISYSHVHLSNGFAKARSLSETDLNKYEQTDDEPRFVSLENQGDTPQFNSDKSKPINIPGSNNKKKNKNPIRST